MTSEAGEPRAGLLLGLALLIVACVYVKVLGGPFIWDDLQLIVGSSAVHKLDLGQAFGQPFWLGTPDQEGSQSYYRPVTSLSFSIDYWLHGDNSAGFHLTSLGLHLLAVGLLFALLRRRGARTNLAFLLCSAWGLLPRLTEGAAWISGRGDVLASVLSLAALSVYRKGSALRLGLALGCGLLALLSKESGLGALFALAVLELAPGSPASTTRPRLSAPKWIALALPLLAYAVLRGKSGTLTLGSGLALGPGGRALASLEALGRYTSMLLDPWQPRSLLGQLGHVAWLYVIFGVLSLVGGALAALRFRPKSTESLAFAVMGLVPLVLVLHWVPLPLSVVAADRYLYLPTAALLLAATPTLQRQVASRPLLLAGLVAFVVSCGVRTLQRVGDYTDEALFWVTAARHAPSDATPFVSLGSAAYRAGLFNEGLSLSLRAFALGGPNAGVALDNAALAATALGDRNRAAQLGQQLVRLFPQNPAYRLRRAAIAFNALDFASARANAEGAAALDPKPERERSFLELIERSRAVVAAGSAPPALRQSVDIEAMRYPEIAARLDSALNQPNADDELVRPGLEALVAHGQPEQARELVARYVRQRTTPEAQRLAEAVLLRSDAAASMRARLSELALPR